MTNFLLGYPHIPFNAASVASSLTAATGFEAENVITGSRDDTFHAATASASDLTLTFSLASALSAQFLYINHADWLQGYLCSLVQLENGSTVYSNAGFASAGLYGPRSEDFLATFSVSAAATSWVLRLRASAASIYPFAKAYFGLFYDFGREPILNFELNRTRRKELAKDAAYAFSLTWQGISDLKVNELIESVLQYADLNPVVLYDAQNCILPECTLLFAKIASYNITPVTVNSNNVTLEFKELI